MLGECADIGSFTHYWDYINYYNPLCSVDMAITLKLHRKYLQWDRKNQDAVFSVYCVVDKTGKTHFKLETAIKLKWYYYGELLLL